MMSVITDHKWRNFMYRYDVPDKVLTSEFAHLSAYMDCDGFIKYRKNWYHLSDFTLVEKNGHLESQGWTGFVSDSMFSGVVIKISDDGETYKIGTVIT